MAAARRSRAHETPRTRLAAQMLQKHARRGEEWATCYVQNFSIDTKLLTEAVSMAFPNRLPFSCTSRLGRN